jgi:CheY-like chemotaxis protein
LRYSRDFWGSAMARVLLVEDEISLLMVAESVVQGLGYSSFSASNVVQAKAPLDDPDEIDLLFTDVRLPESELGGFEVAPQARTRKSESEGTLHDPVRAEAHAVPTAGWVSSDVHYWHIADVPLALTNVRFWGQSGH